MHTQAAQPHIEEHTLCMQSYETWHGQLVTRLLSQAVSLQVLHLLPKVASLHKRLQHLCQPLNFLQAAGPRPKAWDD